MIRNGSVALFLGLLFINLSIALDQFDSFLPENDRRIGVYDKSTSNITETEFDLIVDKFQEIYSPIIEKKNATLLFQKRWLSDMVNAHTYRLSNNWIITIFGGLVRHPKMTNDGLALVICHEIGHQLGGLPKKTIFFSPDWATAEGQADYYASLKCIRRYFADDDNISIVSKMTIDPIVTSKCIERFGRPEEIAICKRSAMSGLTAIQVMDDIYNSSTPSNFATPSIETVSSTMTKDYPTSQCRLDTYLAGALCIISADDIMSETDINLGVCTRDEGLESGARPLCWYKP